MSQNAVKIPESGVLSGLEMAQGINLANDTLASCFMGATPPSPTYPGQWWIDTGTTIDADGPWVRQRNTGNSGWVRRFKANSDLLAQLIAQEFTAATTTGTAPDLVFSSKLGAGVAYAAWQRHTIKFSAAGATTLNRDGLGAVALKRFDSTGSKVDFVSTANAIHDVQHDGTHYLVLNPLPEPQATGNPPVRQTVLSGPVDTNGLPSFGGSTGSTTVTASGTLKATCFAGGDANYTGSITNPSWPGLSINGQNYLFLDITSAGVVTTASSTVAQVCQPGGTPAVTSGLLTVNWQEGKCYLGNGTAAPQAYRMAVGEVTVSGGVVTAITWYQIMGRYFNTTGMLTAGTNYSMNHNIGTKFVLVNVELECVTAEGPYSIGDRISITFNGNFGSGSAAYGCAYRYTNNGFVLTTLSSGIGIRPDAATALSAANWKAVVTINRAF